MIELKEITLELSGKTILKDVSLHILRGTTNIILGPSGAGKSTILKAILGLHKVKKGNVYIDSEDIFNLSEKELLNIRRKIGMVFQGNALFDSLSVAENVTYFLSEREYTDEQLEQKTTEVLSFVNLDGTEHLYPDQLSGGMKKRLAIARALVTDPKIILFDEPTTGLDPINSKAVLNLINKLKVRGTTSVIVTHILNDAISIGDQLTIINDGKIIASGTVNEILQSGNKFVQEFFYDIYQNQSLTR